jgi:hypothetical protein
MDQSEGPERGADRKSQIHERRIERKNDRRDFNACDSNQARLLSGKKSPAGDTPQDDCDEHTCERDFAGGKAWNKRKAGERQRQQHEGGDHDRARAEPVADRAASEQAGDCRKAPDEQHEANVRAFNTGDKRQIRGKIGVNRIGTCRPNRGDEQGREHGRLLNDG